MSDMRLDQPPVQATTGFTLIEMLIVLAMVGILSGIAFPIYRGYVSRMHRADARSALIQAAQWMERAATATGRYPTTAQIPAALTQLPDGRYTISVTSPDPLQAPALNSYRIVATRNPTGSQALDACGDFALDQANRQTILNNAAQSTALVCWRA